jgi:hypothetical protein
MVKMHKFTVQHKVEINCLLHLFTDLQKSMSWKTMTVLVLTWKVGFNQFTPKLKKKDIMK